MSRLLVRVFAVLSYALFLGSFAYFIAFVCGIGVPRTIDRGPDASPLVAGAIDVGLVIFFGLAHSVMARGRFKRAWTRIVPPAAERSAYVLVASAQVALLCWQWRPITAWTAWRATGTTALALQVLCLLGWGLGMASSFLIDHFELFGLRQAFTNGQRSSGPPSLRTPLFYRWVRHPLYLGMLIGCWVTPVMTGGHLLLALLLTAYVFIGAIHEERDLVRVFGESYRRYQEQVPMLLPIRLR